MTITKNLTGSTLDVALAGRLDTTTSPQLSTELENLTGIELLQFDFAELEYISSAGLRVLLSAQKKMNAQGEMKIRNVNEQISEVFNITGFDEILTIE